MLLEKSGISKWHSGQRTLPDHAARISFFVALALTLGGAAFLIAQLEAFFDHGAFKGWFILAGATPLWLGIYIFYEDFWMARRRSTPPARDEALAIKVEEDGNGIMLGLKRKVKLWRESFIGGLINTGNVSATVSGKLVLSWHGTPTQKDGALKMFPVIQQRMMPEASLESFADAVIASIHDGGMARDDLNRNIQTIAMLWRLFTTPVDHNDPGFTYGDLVAVKNFHVAFELHEQPNDQFKVTWNISVMSGRTTPASPHDATSDQDHPTRPADARDDRRSVGASEARPVGSAGGLGAMTTPSELEGIHVSHVVDMRHKLTALIKQNLYGGGSKAEGRAALIARNHLDDTLVFNVPQHALVNGTSEDLRPFKWAVILETFRLQRGAIVVPLAALDLDVLLDELPASAVEPGLDSGALRLEPEAALALPFG